MNLTAAELLSLAKTLDVGQLRFVLSNTGKRRTARKKTEEASSDEPPVRGVSKLNREDLLIEVVELAEAHPKVAHLLLETVHLSPKKIREWLGSYHAEVSTEQVETIVQLLTRSYQHGNQPILIPAASVARLLSLGVDDVVALISETERERRALRDPAPLDFHRLMLERKRREELRPLLAGIGAPEPVPFKPDDFQLEAVDMVLNQGFDVMVSAPTGSGKTWITEQAIRGVLERGQSAWYTSPLKALSNDKFREFSQIFGPEKVGIITGDRRVNPDAPLKIATTEIYRNGLYDAMNGLEIAVSKGGLTRLVVFDEVHYLGDTGRGMVWEESIIYSPPDARILMLSATVGNAQELADWVSWTRDVPCRLVYHPERPVPLRTAFVHANGRLQPLFDESETPPRLHPDIQNLYESAHSETERRRNKKSYNWRRFAR